jgi:glutathione peroxidase-family protein
VRVIVTYTAKVPPLQYGQLEASTMMIVDLPPDTTPEQASETSAQIWRTLHEDYGDQFAEIVNNSMNANGWEAMDKLPSPVKSFASAVKAIWASIGTRLSGVSK